MISAFYFGSINIIFFCIFLFNIIKTDLSRFLVKPIALNLLVFTFSFI